MAAAVRQTSISPHDGTARDSAGQAAHLTPLACLEPPPDKQLRRPGASYSTGAHALTESGNTCSQSIDKCELGDC
jgi:hypothetical protein